MTPTTAELLLARAEDDTTGLLFEDRRWSWREFVAEAAIRAELIRAVCGEDPDRPPHVGAMLDNVPEYLFLLGGAALAGATLVGVNTTRRGEDLARDIRHTHCDLLLVADEADVAASTTAPAPCSALRPRSTPPLSTSTGARSRRRTRARSIPRPGSCCCSRPVRPARRRR